MTTHTQGSRIPILSLLLTLLSSLSFASASCPFLTATLLPKTVSPHVQELQKILNKDKDTQVSQVGPGSPGNETTKYGAGTFLAVKRFQEKYAQEILVPAGLTVGTGRVGVNTRKKLQALCENTPVASTVTKTSSSLTIAKPLPGSTITDIVPFEVSLDPLTVSMVKLYANNQLVAYADKPLFRTTTYQLNWDSRQVGNGPVSLSLLVTNQQGQETKSSPLSYVIANRGLGDILATTTITQVSQGTGTVPWVPPVGVPATSTPPVIVVPPVAKRYITMLGDMLLPSRASSCTIQASSDFMATMSANAVKITPSDCHITKTAQPPFSWPQPSNKKAGTLWHLVVKKDGAVIIDTTTSNPQFLPKSLLSSGTYEWTVNFTNTSGVSVTSAPRHFVVPSNASQVMIPDSEQVLAQVKATKHPRMIPGNVSTSTIVALAANGEYKKEYTTYRRIAKANMTRVLPNDPPLRSKASFPIESDWVKYIQGLASLTRDEHGVIESLAYMYLLTGEGDYKVAGIKRLMNIASWSPSGATSEIAQDQANREIYLSLAIGYDAFYQDLSVDQKKTIITALKARLLQVVPSYANFNVLPYRSHDETALFMTNQTMLYVLGEPGLEEADAWFTRSWNLLATIGLDLWGEDDGGFGNGVSYAWYSMVTYSHALAAIDLMTGVNLAKTPWMSRSGDFLIAMTTPNVDQLNAFGNGLETVNMFRAYSTDYFRLLALLTQNNEYSWYWRQNPYALLDPYISALHFVLSAARGSQVNPVPPTKKTYLFEDIGVVAMHNDPSRQDRTSVFFKSSPFGSDNHSHADQNSFTFTSSGKTMLINSGYYDYYNSPHNALEGRATMSKNALTFDKGIGQAELLPLTGAPGKPVYQRDFSGKLINFFDNGVQTITTGDATLAYRGKTAAGALSPLLTNAIRSVVYDRSQGVVVLYDYATSDTPRTWELNFHGLASFAKKKATAVQIDYQGVSACVETFGPSGSFVTTSGFTVPSTLPEPNEYHARFSVASPSKEFGSVTIIRENCNQNNITVSFVGTTATVTLSGKDIVFEKKKVMREE